jgi:hypothetical protein
MHLAQLEPVEDECPTAIHVDGDAHTFLSHLFRRLPPHSPAHPEMQEYALPIVKVEKQGLAPSFHPDDLGT